MQQQTVIKITGLATMSEIARRLDTSPQRVGHWFKKGVPPYEVIPFCAALEWAVTPHQVNPRLYPNPTDSLPDDYKSTVPTD